MDDSRISGLLKPRAISVRVATDSSHTCHHNTSIHLLAQSGQTNRTTDVAQRCASLKSQSYGKISVKTEIIYRCYRLNTSKTAEIGTVNLVVEHIVTMPKSSATKFTVPIFAVFDVWVYNTCKPQQPSCVPILNSLASDIAEILKGNSQIVGSSPSLKPHPRFLMGGTL